MRQMTIGEVARKTGIQPSTIRYYERIGLLPAPERLSGQRRYRPDILRTLAAIQLARSAGLRLSEVRELLHGFAEEMPASSRWQAIARSKLDEVESQIEGLEQRKGLLQTLGQCRCPTVEECAAALATGC